MLRKLSRNLIKNLCQMFRLQRAYFSHEVERVIQWSMNGLVTDFQMDSFILQIGLDFRLSKSGITQLDLQFTACFTDLGFLQKTLTGMCGVHNGDTYG